MYPNKTQEELLAKTFGCVRVVWNACVDSFNSYDKETNPNPKFPTKSDLVIEKPWLNEVSAATLQQKQRDFIEFSRQYFNNNRKEKLGRPNYKNKHDNQSFRLPFPKFKITNNKIRIEKIGWVKIVIDRGVPDNARFISCTVSKNRAGQYFVSVLVETEQCYKQKTSKTVGVDLGIKTLATLSDGIAVENPHFLCENQAKLKRMQRHLSRKKLGSNRRNKCRLKYQDFIVI
jgi:putative transposase